MKKIKAGKQLKNRHAAILRAFTSFSGGKMRYGIVCSALAIGTLLVTSSGMADSASKMESIVLNGGSIGSITFPHGRHQGIYVDCRPCHDLFGKESMVIDKMKSEGKLQKKEVMNLCKNCHKEMAAKGEKAGPTDCKGCHQK